EHEDGEELEEAVGHVSLRTPVELCSRTDWPSRNTQHPTTSSSCQSGATTPSRPSNARRFSALRAKSRLAWFGMPDGGLVTPTTMVPSTNTSSPATVSSQFPPLSAAKSM